MIIKSLTMENFRQFQDVQTINFSCDEKRKSTLVIAKNHTGKTTIIESFSWVFYGKTNLKSILNSEIKDKMNTGDSTNIVGVVELLHSSIAYTITRNQKFTKTGRGISEDKSFVKIGYKTLEGLKKEHHGLDAEKEINTIIPEELFSYFFFKGEQIERIGKEINSQKSTKHKEFVNAIRGMLGFNWLYQTQADLKTLSKQYNEEIASNKTDGKLADLAKRESSAFERKDKYEGEIETIEQELSKLTQIREQKSKEIMRFGDAEKKQKEARNLESKCKTLKDEIKVARKSLFVNFSEDAFALFSEKLIYKAFELLTEDGDIEKGIPGLEASAVQYLLDNAMCICGREVAEKSKEYNILEELIKYLPPNNLGHEIELFKNNANNYLDTSRKFYESVLKQRQSLFSLLKQYDEAVKKLNEINNEIQNIDDVSKIKAEERSCASQIDRLNQDKGYAESEINSAKNEIEKIQKEKSQYEVTDGRYKKILVCKEHVDILITKMDKYFDKKESEKRIQLQDAINSIYNEIFNIGIAIELDENYNIMQIANDNVDLEEFQNSTSQDAIMAFSFIGGIIKLARNKMINNQDENEIDSIENTEPYPLVMDAPSSSFDIERIERFCQIMPKIAEQVIFFIKDTDGLYVKQYLDDSIGKEYKFNQINNYHTVIEEV